MYKFLENIFAIFVEIVFPAQSYQSKFETGSSIAKQFLGKLSKLKSGENWDLVQSVDDPPPP